MMSKNQEKLPSVPAVESTLVSLLKRLTATKGFPRPLLPYEARWLLHLLGPYDDGGWNQEGSVKAIQIITYLEGEPAPILQKLIDRAGREIFTRSFVEQPIIDRALEPKLDELIDRRREKMLKDLVRDTSPKPRFSREDILRATDGRRLFLHAVLWILVENRCKPLKYVFFRYDEGWTDFGLDPRDYDDGSDESTETGPYLLPDPAS